MTQPPAKPCPEPGQVDVVCFHKGCHDGIGAAYVIWKIRAGEGVAFLPVCYGDTPPPPEALAGRHVLVVDFSWPRAVIDAQVLPHVASLLVIDHHKSAAEELAGHPNALFDMDRSGATLAWDWAHPGAPRPRVLEYIEDRDLWRWALPDSRAVSAALMSEELTFPRLHELAVRPGACEELAAAGAPLVAQEQRTVADLARGAAVVDAWGLRVAVVNASALISEVGNALAARDGVDVALVWYARHYDNGAAGCATRLSCSLRAAADSGVDCATLAARFGGGGHACAAGFRPNGSIEALLATIRDAK